MGIIRHLHNDTHPPGLKYEHNTLVFSELKTFEKSIQSEGVSIKYVSSGVENYFLNKKQMALQSGEYFISNEPLDGKVTIDSEKSVKGICLNIRYNLIREVEASLGDDKYFEAEHQSKTSILLADIHDVYRVSNNHLSQKIHQLSQIRYQTQPFEKNAEEYLFAEMAEAFVLDLEPQLQYLSRLNKANSAVKKDIIKRLLWAKEYLESNYHKDIHLNDLSRIAAMSDFHFSRMFKQVFGCPPYQYQVKIRMEKAKMLLSSGHVSVYETGLLVGYSDIFTFSKAFKRFYHTSPSTYLK